MVEVTRLTRLSFETHDVMHTYAIRYMGLEAVSEILMSATRLVSGGAVSVLRSSTWDNGE